MTIAKATRIAKDIDFARCRGDWPAIPDLARRYKKYNPNDTVFLQTVLAESHLNQLIDNLTAQSDANYVPDMSGNTIITPQLKVGKVERLQQQLCTVLTDDGVTAEPQKQFAKVVLARTYFACGLYPTALDLLNNGNLKTTAQGYGYAWILALQARAVTAISLEMTGQIVMALEEYHGIVQLLDNKVNIPADNVFIDWAEEALYRGSLLAMQHSTSDTLESILDLLKMYQLLTSQQSFRWRPHKRILIIRHSLRYLVAIHQQKEGMGETVQSIAGKTPGISIFDGEHGADIMHLHTMYEKLVFSVAPFPRAGQTNTTLFDFADQLASDFESVQEKEHLQRYIETLHRISRRTYNSPRITRYLFLALARFDDCREALHCLHSYLLLVGLSTQESIDSRGVGRALAVDSHGVSMTMPNLHGLCPKVMSNMPHSTPGARSISIKQGCENEAASDILTVLMAAMALYIQLKKGTDAVEMAERALTVMPCDINDSVAACLYRLTGVAYGLLASQTIDEETRPIYHQRALDHLLQATTLDPREWTTYYELALQQAEMRRISEAAKSITRSLQINAEHLPSWHLLVLLQSCPALERSPRQMLETCAIALEKAENQENWEQAALLKTTQILLVASLDGPESALKLQKQVLQSCGPMLTSLETVEDEPSTVDDTLVPTPPISLSDLSDQEEEMQMSKAKQRRSSLNSGEYEDGERTSFSIARVALSRRTRSISILQTRRRFSSPSLDSLRTFSGHYKRLSWFGSKPSIFGKGRQDDDHGSSKLPPSVTQLDYLQGETKPSLRNEDMLPTTGRKQQARQWLCNHWVISANLFLKLGKVEEAFVAVQEAEKVSCGTSSNVWCMLGKVQLAMNRQGQALDAFQKGLVVDQGDIECQVCLAKTLIEEDDLEVAESILAGLTRGKGWNNAEAWYHLAMIYQRTERWVQAKDALLYALELEPTQPIQSFANGAPRGV